MNVQASAWPLGRRHLLRAALALAACAALPAYADISANTAPNEPTQRLHALFATSFEEATRRAPEWATYRGDHRYGDRLTDASPEAQAERDAAVRRYLEQAQAVPTGALSAQDRISRELFIEAQQRQLEQAAFAGWRTMSLRALGGPHTQLADLLAVSPMSRTDLVEKSLARLAAYPLRIDQEIANLKRGLAAGWVPPREVLQRVLAQIDALRASGVGIVLSTHDPDQVFAHGTQVALLHGGRLLACGAPESVVTEAALRQVYGIDVEILAASRGDGQAVRVCWPRYP